MSLKFVNFSLFKCTPLNLDLRYFDISHVAVQYDYNLVEFNMTIEEKSRELLLGHICWRVCVFVKFVKKLCAALEKVGPDFFYGGDDIMIMQAYFVDYVRNKFSYISYIMY